MDVDKLIQDQQADIDRIKRAITCLEQLRNPPLATDTGGTKTRDRRGGKSMGPEERKDVSARMKRYWARQRNRVQD
jgi:hypothetical protein